MTHEIPADLEPLFTVEDGRFVPEIWWWSGDQFVIKLVALLARKLRVDGHGYPGDMTPQEWNDYLQAIEDDLSAYDKFVNLEEGCADAYVRAQDAMRRFVDHMSAWWD